MSENRRVVITGLGATTPLGATAPATWEALLAGKSGARTLEESWVSEYELPVTFAATLAESPASTLAKVELKRMDPFTQYAMVAAREAWADAGRAPTIASTEAASSASRPRSAVGRRARL